MATPHLRLACTDDAADIAAIYAPFCTSTIVSFETEAPAAEEIARRIAKTRDAGLPWLVAADGGVLGYAYAATHRERAAYRWSVDVSVYLGEGLRGRGAGRVLYGALAELLRLQGYHRAYAGVAQPNAASERLHLAAGFREVGTYQGVGFKLGAWRDVRWFELPLAETPEAAATAQPGEPVGITAITDDQREEILSRWSAALATAPPSSKASP